MVGANLRNDVEAAMRDAGQSLSPDILSKCVAMASNYNLTQTQLVESWEAHSMNKDVEELNDRTFAAFRSFILKDVAEISGGGGASSPVVASGAVVPRSALGKRSNPHENDEYGVNNLVTPPASKRSASVNTGISSVDAIGSHEDSNTPGSPSRNAYQPPTPESGSSAIVTPSKSLSLHIVPEYDDRSNIGEVVASYNPHSLPEIDNVNKYKRKCTIAQPDPFPHPRKVYRHMFSPTAKRARALDEHLQNLSEEMIQEYHIPTSSHIDEEYANEDDAPSNEEIAPLQPVGIPRQSPQTCIGRICNEAHTGKINSTSILLEGSRSGSNGARINVDLSNIIFPPSPSTNITNNFSLFSGQIVAIEGMNSTGRKFTASRICEGVPPKPLTTSANKLLSYHHDAQHQDGEGWKMMVATGPYTTSDNLDYIPLFDLIAQVQEEQPDVVILMGPFVDARQPLLKDGEVILEKEGDNDGEERKQMFVTFETLFLEKVIARLEDFYESDEGRFSKTQFVLVPSINDPLAETVYPQPPLTDRLSNKGRRLKIPGAEEELFGTLGIHYIEEAGRIAHQKHQETPKRIHCVSNPCTLQINEVTVGITSTDALLHLSTDETNANLEPGSRITRLAQHFLQQRSYYPLFPPPSLPGMEMNLELTKMKQWNMPCQPDLLILPSKLTTFARCVLEKTVVVNPGHLVKGNSGGTYGIMNVHPMKRESLQSVDDVDVEIEHNIQDRIRVDIKRI